jgi:predicted HNH restriction endonuclease
MLLRRNKLEGRPLMPTPNGGAPSAGRNPAWVREELILALDAYVRWAGNPPSKLSPEVENLSADIGALRRSLGTVGDAKLRNVNGVYMKLMNFRRFDHRFQAEGKVGLTRGNKLEAAIWDEFAFARSRLERTAQEIRTSVANERPAQKHAG